MRETRVSSSSWLITNQMLPRRNRISRKNFPSHQAKSVRGFSTFFTAVFYSTKNKESRASVVVSKKTAKSAVVRNKLRRRFYELLGFYFKSMTPTTIVVYPKKEAQLAQYEVLKTELGEVIKKAKLLK